MRSERRRAPGTGWCAALLLSLAGCSAMTAPTATEPAAVRSVPSRPADDPAASSGVVAPGTCWLPPGAPLMTALTRCGRMGVALVELDVTASPGLPLRACATPSSCALLSDVLAATAVPGVLLRTPVAWLDDVQEEAGRPTVAARWLVAPRFDRPAGAARRELAPGLHYLRHSRKTPRPAMIHIVEVDLETAAVEFVVTTARPDAGLEYAAEKTSVFATRERVLAAVNAGYFRPFDGGRLMSRPYVPAAGQAVEVDGVSISRGQIGSPATNADPRVDGAFCVTPGGLLIAAVCPPGTTEAVGGGPVLLRSGQPAPLNRPVNGPSDATARSRDASMASNEVPAYFREPQPRTAVGFDRGGRRLWLVVVDGRQPGYSEGIALSELAQLFIDLGASDALNLDGGGSSTLVLEQTGGKPGVVNSPIHTQIPGRERPVANHLGLRLRVGHPPTGP